MDELELDAAGGPPTPPASASGRLWSIDHGAAWSVIMALDPHGLFSEYRLRPAGCSHQRRYFLTRWITHYCNQHLCFWRV